MDASAKALLTKLLFAGEKEKAGVRSRSASLTKSYLKNYRQLTSLQKKDSFEETMRDAQARGAITLKWDDSRSQSGFIQRIDLIDARILANFLGTTLEEDQITIAREKLLPLLEEYPVINDILTRWSEFKKVRGLGSDSVVDWLDAVRTIEYCKESNTTEGIILPIREASAKLFNKSKRVERLVIPLDVLLTDSIEGEIREAGAVWQELGLHREEQPVRLAGNVKIERINVTAYLDKPYIGLPPQTIKELVSLPEWVMTIENQTTFHSEARRLCDQSVLLIYTAGMPSPLWRSMYHRILKGLPDNIPIYHWGDIDEGGFRIAATIAADARNAGHLLKPWNMHPQDITEIPPQDDPENPRRTVSQKTLEKMKHFADAAGWPEIGEEIMKAKLTVEQESFT